MEGTSGDQVGSRIPQPPAERQNEMSRAPTKFLTTQEIQQKLEENAMLIKVIHEKQSIGHLKDCIQYQQKLQQNLLELAALADAQAAPRVVPHQQDGAQHVG